MYFLGNKARWQSDKKVIKQTNKPKKKEKTRATLTPTHLFERFFTSSLPVSVSRICLTSISHPGY